MKVQAATLHDGNVHIVFDDTVGIQIEEFVAKSLRRQLQAWKTGEIYEFQEGENSFVFVDLARDEEDADHMHFAFEQVWCEIPVTTGMELLAELERSGDP